MPFYRLDKQPTEPAIEKAFAGFSTRDITLFTAKLILETLERQPPHSEYCRFPFTEAEAKEMMEMLEKAEKDR